MSNKKLNIWYIFLLLQPVIDIVTSFMVRYSNASITLGVVIRGLFITFMCIYLLFFNKSKYKKISIIYLLTVVLFSILYVVTKDGIFAYEFIKNEIVYLFKYMYFPMSFICLFNFFQENNLNIKINEKILQIVLCIITFSILIANLTNTSFVSYQYTSEGIIGWFYAANEISAIVTILCPILFLYLNKCKSIFSILIFLPVTVSICLIGTKTSFLGLIIVLILYFIYYFIFGITHRKKILQFIIISILLMSVIQISPRLTVVNNFKLIINSFINNMDSSTVDKGNTADNGDVIGNNNTDKDNIDKGNEINSKPQSSIKNEVLSNRNDFFNNAYSIYKKAPINEKLFGIGFSNRNDYKIDKLIEMDILDILFRYGVLGFVVYFAPFVFIMVEIIKLIVLCIINQKKLFINELTYMYSIAIAIGVSTLAGHVFGAPSVSIYISVIIILLYMSLKNKFKEIDNKKITIFALHLGTGGVEKYIASLCKMLNNKFEIEIVCTYKLSSKPAFEFDNNIEITYLVNSGPHKEQFNMALKSKNVLNIIKEGIINAGILLLKTFKNILYISNVESKYIITTRFFHSNLVSKYANGNIIKIATEHNYHNNNNKYVKKVINSLDSFDYFVLVSKELKDFYTPLLPEIECVYIPNTIDYIPPKRSIKLNNTVISIGRLSKEKGFSDLLNVIYEVKKRNNKIKLILIGEGIERKNLENQIKHLNLKNNVNLLGNIDNDKISMYLKKSSVYVMTSYSESFGIVLLEAMSNSIPCIAFDSASGAKELLKNGVGILVKNRDITKMSNEIINLISDDNLNAKYASNGYELCKKYLTSNVEKEWIKLLK